MLTLHSLAKALGGRVVGSTVRAPGPGHSKFDDSLVVSLADNDDGFVVTSHAGDDFRECKDHVRDRMGLEEFGAGRHEIDPAEKLRRELALKTLNENAERRAADKLKHALQLWSAALPFAGSLAETYIVGRLAGFPVPDPVYDGEALRWISLDRLPRHFREVGQGAAGAMVALMTDPLTIEPTGVHLTFIRADGSNLKGEKGSVRRMWGTQGVVRLWPDADVERRVAIGEGIESCLSGQLLRNGPPTWSAIDAGGVAGFPVLPSVEFLLVYTDNDKSETGQRSAVEVKAAWEAAGRFVVVEMPPDTGQDFNDFLVSLKRESTAA